MSKSSSTTPSLDEIKAALEKMMEAVQKELHKVDSEWTQMCSIAGEQVQEIESDNKSNVTVTPVEYVDCNGLDDPDVVNELSLQL